LSRCYAKNCGWKLVLGKILISFRSDKYTVNFFHLWSTIFRSWSLKNMWKVYKNHSQLLNGLGVGQLTPETFLATEKFLCQMYNVPNHLNNVDQARCLLFIKANKHFPLRCFVISCNASPLPEYGLEAYKLCTTSSPSAIRLGGTKRREKMFQF